MDRQWNLLFQLLFLFLEHVDLLLNLVWLDRSLRIFQSQNVVVRFQQKNLFEFLELQNVFVKGHYCVLQFLL